MKRLLLALGLAIGAGAPAMADHAHHNTTIVVQQAPVVVVTCFRGPLNQIIWDHPQARFIDSLVNIGYSFSQATAIAERVCRDQSLVGNSAGLESVTREIIRSAPRN